MKEQKSIQEEYDALNEKLKFILDNSVNDHITLPHSDFYIKRFIDNGFIILFQTILADKSNYKIDRIKIKEFLISQEVKKLKDKVDNLSEIISELTVTNLKLQNDYLPRVIKQTKNQGIKDLLLFIGGALVTYGGVFLTSKLSETTEQNKLLSEIKIVLSPTTKDTTVKIYADSCGVDSSDGKNQ